MFAKHRRIKQLGILGMNCRNADYIHKFNPRKNFPLVDNKLKTKELAILNNIAVPKLYCTIQIEAQLKQLKPALQDCQDFVVKPAHGSGGDGIIVITGRRKDYYQKSNGSFMTQDELEHHISNILSGMYSLGGHRDLALIEARVKFDPIFESVSYQGVPDIRMIVFLGYPTMGMVRLPTRASTGKANLHQGAIGVGIDLATGITKQGVWHNHLTDTHPDTGNEISDIQIPDWRNLMDISARCYEITGLGYLGVDIVLDRNAGPLMLELNARPGLSIQLANRCGLLPRLRKVEMESELCATPHQRIEFSIRHFGG